MSDSFNLSKPEIVANETQRIDETLTGEDWTAKEKIVLACQILGAHGHDSGLAGQITNKSESGYFITQRFGCGMDEVSVSNLLTVDEHLNVVDGKGMPNPANRFHSWIYRCRPDARCIIHTHPLYTSALSMLEQPLQLAHMDTCVLFDDIAFLPDWPGIPVGNDEGELISSALGDKRAILLAHHGLVVVSSSVEEACIIAVQFERAAKLHMIASAAGKIQVIDPALGKEAHDWILREKRTLATFAYLSRKAIKNNPSCLSPD